MIFSRENDCVANYGCVKVRLVTLSQAETPSRAAQSPG